MSTSVTRPASTVQPLTMRMMPPVAIVFGFSTNGSAARISAVALENRIGVDDADQRDGARR